LNNNHSPHSERLIQKVVSSGYLKMTNVSQNYNNALLSVGQDNADIILEIPPRFEEDLINKQTAIKTNNNVKMGCITTL